MEKKTYENVKVEIEKFDVVNVSTDTSELTIDYNDLLG